MIKPTVGRVVWYWMPNSPQREPLAAMVAAVVTDSIVNLSVIDAEGNQFGQKGVPLVQDGEQPPSMAYCEWMPYQKGQAAKTEALESTLKGAKS
jgi:hypothetical protein